MPNKIDKLDEFYTVFNGEQHIGGLCSCGGYLLQTKRMYIKPPCHQYSIGSHKYQQLFRFMETDCFGEYKSFNITKKNLDYNGAEYRCHKCNTRIILLKDYGIDLDLKYYERNIVDYYNEDK